MKPTTATPSNIVPMYPDPTVRPADSAGRLAVSVPVFAGHFRAMLARELYSPRWHDEIVSGYFHRILIAIGYHRGDFGISPGTGQTLAASLAKYKADADAWGNIKRRPTAQFTFEIDSVEWQKYRAAAAAVGVPLAALVRAAFAHRVRHWLGMDADKAATNRRSAARHEELTNPTR
jgi:hypothetical protein